MPISIRNGLITIQTAGTTYQMKADSLSTLIHTYYGPKIDGTDMSPLIVPRDRGFSGNPAEVGMFDKTYSLDTLPLELSS
ncbi:MAG: alpha-galactosidase, partial [Lachnospiraceae bacterium]|nr:alpha-galactosidase [Lachnospiraceae bacterium]